MWNLKINLFSSVLLVFLLSKVVSLPFNNEHNTIRYKRDLNAIQEKLRQSVNPEPIVDTMTEAEKCCNNVQHVIGKTFLNAYEQMSQVLANVLQFPKTKISLLGSGVTKVLDQIGGKLVGLNK